MKPNERRAEMPDAPVGVRRPALAVEVLYPSESLAEQIAEQADQWSAYRFTAINDGELPGESHPDFAATVVLVDATYDPGRALAAVRQAMAVSDARVVAVYTETLHEGLEVSVRSRGALLMVGPIDDGQWEGLFEAGRRVARRDPRFGFLTTQANGGKNGSGPARPPRRHWGKKPYRKTA